MDVSHTLYRRVLSFENKQNMRVNEHEGSTNYSRNVAVNDIIGG